MLNEIEYWRNSGYFCFLKFFKNLNDHAMAAITNPCASFAEIIFLKSQKEAIRSNENLLPF